MTVVVRVIVDLKMSADTGVEEGERAAQLAPPYEHYSEGIRKDEL